MDQKHKSPLSMTECGFCVISSGETQTKVRIRVPRIIPAQVRAILIPVARVAKVRVHGFLARSIRSCVSAFRYRRGAAPNVVKENI